MSVEEILEYCQTKKSVSEHFPFGPDNLVLKVGGKMFLLISLENQPLSFACKGDPEKNLDLREKHHQITGAYHMNKTHWNSIVCEGLKKNLIIKLIDHSYDLVLNSLPKKTIAEILARYMYFF